MLAAQLLFLVADVVVCVISFLEHGRNPRPSTLLITYLALTIFSLTSAGLQYVAWNLCIKEGLTVSIFVTRFALLVLESQTKISILREPYTELSLEQAAGFFDVVFFWWVNKVLKMGYSKNIGLVDIPALDKSLDALKIRDAMRREWDKRSTFILVLSLTTGFMC